MIPGRGQELMYMHVCIAQILKDSNVLVASSFQNINIHTCPRERMVMIDAL